ncbi:MAG TPA: tricarballylate utilization 4Fe-4S protein TcuB [Myxococcales bacterium]|nr:tricarballylate utilization 4Fe-4S protein TcuB [Myxococcales bacterium]
MPLADLLKEGERVMTICNACRYCEGHCAVFPAMERRTAFPQPDLIYLANLCHGCGSCYHHCQYAPPHPFAVNVPKIFSELRTESYKAFAWPGFLARTFDRNPLTTALVAAGSLALLFFIAGGGSGLTSRHLGSGAFYAVVSHAMMVGLFGAVFLAVVAVLGVGLVRFWRQMSGGTARPADLRRAVSDTLRLRYLDGGGDGCTYPTEAPSKLRRFFHHLTFYGFLLCFASTTVAAIYDGLLGWQAPYTVTSLPVLLGTAGGIGLLAGPVGLFALKLRSDPAPNPRGTAFAMDVAFLALLFWISATGLALLVLRATAAMGVLLAIHLGFVLALFLSLPYGKFVHAVYRYGALVRHAMESRQCKDR